MKNCGKVLFYSYIMNIFDLVATLMLVMRFGLDVEGNPFGRLLLSEPVWAFVYKVFGIAALLLVLYLFRSRKLAVYGSYTVFFAYSALSIYHLAIIAMTAV